MGQAGCQSAKQVEKKVDSNLEKLYLQIFELIINETPLFKKFREPLQNYIDLTELSDVVKNTTWKSFDPSAWVRKDQF